SGRRSCAGQRQHCSRDSTRSNPAIGMMSHGDNRIRHSSYTCPRPRAWFGLRVPARFGYRGGCPMAERIRVVVAKPGLDGHDRGAKVIARALRDAGMEVIYTGLHQTPEQIVQTVIQEDADAVGLSVLSGAHMTLFARTMELLAEREVTDVVVFGGGIIPDADIPELERLGVAKIFTPGASIEEIVEWVRSHVGTREPAEH